MSAKQTPSIIGKIFRAYEKPSSLNYCVVLENRYQDDVLLFENNTLCTAAGSEFDTFKRQCVKIVDAYGCLGVLNVNIDNKLALFLVLVTGCQSVGKISDAEIFKITQTTFVSLRKQQSDDYASEVRKLLNSGSFYFSRYMSQDFRFDLTLCAQRQWNNCVPDNRFFWNRNLHIYFIHFGINTTQWLMKIVCGSIEIKTVYARHKQARIAIISRLSCRRAGTRFNVRGCNDDGYVANFVETEQVIYLDDEVTSFLQIRGSVPLFWEQPGMNVGAHKVKLSRSIESSADVYEKHVKSLKDCYGNIIFINLLGGANVNSKENESALSYAFEQKHSTSSFSFIPFVAFDYHQEFKSNGEKSLQKLKSVVNPYLDSFGIFYAKGNSVIKHQTGSMRINCTDCLDRTNCIQKFFALEVLAKQLEFLCQNETDQIISRFEEVFQQLWVNNGNEISRIYAGTGAIQGGSKILDGARSAARTIQNNLLDSSKQEGFDILLSGNALNNELSAKAKALLPYNTWQCHPDLIEEVCSKYKSYTYKSILRIAVATYNVNGGKHFLNFDSNNLESLSEWLLDPYEVSLFDQSKEFFLNDNNNLPDIYAIGFEEIVDLNASNIMAASTDNADSWNKNLKNVLSSKRDFLLLTSTQLVGVCLFVFIKPELLPYIKDVTTDSVKTGMGGATGNKGAVMVRFTLNATNLCFICSHFAAGQSQVADRNADFHEITRKLKTSIQSNDYVYWCGDFNYRVDMDRLDLINHVQDGDLDEVLKYDQLLAQFRDKKVFDGFQEAPITFPPTYKYDILSDEYDSSDKCRTPAWTDRVLWYCNENNDWPNGKQVFYGRANIKESDHRPVMASYEIDILCVDLNQRERELNIIWNEYGPVDGVIFVHIENTDFPINDETFKSIMLQGLGSFGKILNVRYFTDHAEIIYENGRFASNALKIKQISINSYTLILTPKDKYWASVIKNEIETITNNIVPLWTEKLRPAPTRPPLPTRTDQSPSSDSIPNYPPLPARSDLSPNSDGMPNYPPPSNVPLPPLPPRQRMPPPLPPRNTTMMLNKWMQNLDPCSQELYLCNFRVSVEGEWLCLREITDDPLSDIFPSQCLTSPDLPFLLDRDPVLIERRNLVNISKLIVKELIENSLKNGRMLDSDHPPLQHFFIVLEHVLRHGLRPKKGLLGPKKELWDILQIVEKLTPDAQELANSIRDLPTVKTQMGRARAWLRVALMQKKLADYLKILVDNRDEELVDYFEPDALMMSDEAIIIVGLMVGLNVIDCNLCIKEEDLDSQQGVIDFSLYLRSSHHSSHHVQGTVSCPDSPLGLESENMNVVLDQKNYIEELNCHLKATVANLESKVEILTTSNTLVKEELDMAKTSLTTLKEENQLLKNQLIKQHEPKDIESITVDIPTGDIDTLKQFAENEKRQRIETEKELHLQMSLKAEMEVAMKLLEKESREKQENIVSLRKQLDDIKIINLEMYKKLQECEEDLTKKAEMVSRLQKKTEQIGCLLSNLQFHDAQQLRMRNNAGMKNSNSDTRSKINDEEKKKMSESVLRYHDQIAAHTMTIAKLKEDMIKEQQSKCVLEDRLAKAGNQTVRLDEEITQLKAMSNEYVHLQEEHHRLKDKYQGQERALEELAGQLKKEILKSNELEEAANSSLAQAHWERDNEVINCKKCEKEFSITRRKHHCRNCGGIFCALCSDNTMMLPSSAKPVRVCDDCNILLVGRYSVVPNN